MYKSLVRLIFLLQPLLYCFYSSAQSIDSVKVGNGGGFSGQTTVYKIVGKKIWKAQGIGSPQYVLSAKLRHKVCKHVKKEGKIILKETPFDEPSNTYKWLELFSEGKSYKYVWGDPRFTPPTSVLSYYQSLNELITTLTFK